MLAAVATTFGAVSCSGGQAEPSHAPSPKWLQSRSLPDRTIFPGTTLASASGRFEASIGHPWPGAAHYPEQGYWCVEVRTYKEPTTSIGPADLAWVNGLFHDLRCYAEWAEEPTVFWDLTLDRIWIVVERSQSDQGAPTVRLVEQGPGGVWTARDLAKGEDTALPQDVLAAKPPEFWTRRASSAG
ncbi:hypothetical protein [Yinghuangia seranimata]|uniref:hypothetical protein n=1 Tax=Yinghuangia seranimata TaxID=408067 RepID=UPI00248C3472|nr:hypothetical protein [Yinghuangia seranimata]MDI2128182.1 hypothetical protein [Yinghuangia seranimata]